MSWNRENVIWQSKDKTWNIGFFRQEPVGSWSDDPDYDPEWDVEYDYDSFSFASVGHRTEQQARAAWNGANPGGSTVYTYGKTTAKEIANFDRMAQWHLHPELAEAAAKKEAAKLKREHVKKLKEQFAENNDFKGRNVTVTVKLDDNSYTVMGASQSVTGYAHVEGDWLMVEKVQVKNMKTGRFNRKLHAIKPVVARTNWGRGW